MLFVCVVVNQYMWGRFTFHAPLVMVLAWKPPWVWSGLHKESLEEHAVVCRDL